jgi:DNA-directed RNA polymerase specialized sigma subunit
VANEDLKSKELEIFKKWKQTQDPKHFQALYGSMKGLIYSAAKKASYGSNLPESAHKVYAAQAFLDALKSYQPGKGTALQSHVYGSINNKVKRLNYEYGNIAHIPEPRMMSVGLYQSELENLKGELNRMPSTSELADRLKWSMTETGRMQKELRRDLALDTGSEEHSFFESSIDDEILNYTYYELGPQEKLVFEHIYGRNGRRAMVKSRPNGKNIVDFAGIARATSLSESKVRSLVLNIRSKLTEALKK